VTFSAPDTFLLFPTPSTLSRLPPMLQIRGVDLSLIFLFSLFWSSFLDGFWSSLFCAPPLICQGCFNFFPFPRGMLAAPSPSHWSSFSSLSCEAMKTTIQLLLMTSWYKDGVTLRWTRWTFPLPYTRRICNCALQSYVRNPLAFQLWNSPSAQLERDIALYFPMTLVVRSSTHIVPSFAWLSTWLLYLGQGWSQPLTI